MRKAYDVCLQVSRIVLGRMSPGVVQFCEPPQGSDRGTERWIADIRVAGAVSPRPRGHMVAHTLSVSGSQVVALPRGQGQQCPEKQATGYSTVINISLRRSSGGTNGGS